MTSEAISFLIAPTAAVVVSLVFLWLAHREAKKTAALVAQLKEELRLQMDEQIRRTRELSVETPGVPAPADLKEGAADFVRGAFRLFGAQSKEIAEDLAVFNEQQRQANERIKRGARRTQGGVV